MINKKKPLVAAAIVALTLSVAGAPAAAGNGPKNQIKTFMLNTGVDPAYRGMVLFVSNKAQSFFMIKLTNMDPNSPYDVNLDGAAEETITTNSSGEGMVLHQSRSHGTPTPLPYDPRGHTLSITEQGTIVLTTDFPATPQEGHTLVKISLDLTPATGVIGTATARFRTRFGRMAFDVEMMGSAPGSYDLLVAGVNVGSITVDASGNGDIHFDTRPESDPNEGDGIDLLMTFDPRGESIEIQHSAVDVFSGTFPLIP